MYFLRTAGPLLYVLLNSLATFGQTAALRGEVRSPEGRPLAYASVGLVGTAYGGTTDEEGAFLLSGLPTGSHRLRISMLGYLAHEQPVELHEGAEVSLGPIELEPTQWALQEVVVTGTMKETFVRDSPVKVEVITSRFLERNSSPTSLVESISLVNGVQEVVSCGVCFTNSISINGLPGAYTAILVDGAPMFGNLASVYGLNGIPASLIERLEVIKGPSSTLYGSEA
ncbi:MAG: TonB-dependent receptor, partial [Saprospiraceae bacterium]|nr:TonB-dependent receptor [Saprospiraceae bacterium]